MSEPYTPPIAGMIVATLTPYGRDGRVDVSQVRAHVDYLAEAGIPAIAPAGTTGEFLYLSDEEKTATISASVEAARGRLKVIAGVWSERPAGIVALSQAATDAGADALFFTTPIYYPHGDDSLYAYYAYIRERTQLPLFCYSIPQYAVNSISVPLVMRLVDEKVVDGIKDSTGKADRVGALLEAVGERTAVYAASDGFILGGRRLGAHGFISALANIFPRTCVRIWEQDDAVAQEALNQVRSAVKGYGGISGLKALLQVRGFDFGATRLPFTELDESARAELAQAVAQCGDLT